MKSSRTEVVYTPSSQIYHPKALVKQMYDDLLESYNLGWQLLSRDIKAQYRESFLGIFWAVVPAAVAAVGFATAANSGILNVGDTPIPYPAYVMLGTSLWQTFVEACNGPQQAIMGYKALLLQVKFPHEAIIWSKLGQILFSLAIKLFFVAILFILFQVRVTWLVIFSPIPLLSLVLFGTAFGLFFVPILNLVQDITRTLQFGILAWFFITPVVYPAPTEGFLSIIVQLNPVTPLLVTARESLTTGQFSSLSAFWWISLFSLIALFFGWIVFRLSIPYIAERIS